MAFATLDQFWTYGLRSASFAQAGRPIASVDPTANVFVLAMHGLALNAEVRFAPGSTSASLPGGLSPSATYYAIPTGSDLFQVAAAPDGGAIDLTSAGAGALQMSASPEPRILAQLDADASVMQGALIAFGTIVAPYPLEIVQVNCHLSAFNLCGTFGLVNPLHPVEDGAIITARYNRARAILEEWRGGRRPAGVVDSSTTVEENAPVGWADPDGLDQPVRGPVSGIAALAARFRRLGEEGDARASDAVAVDLRGRLEGVLGDHIRTGQTIGDTVVSSSSGAVTVSGPRGLRFSPGAEAEIHKPVGAVALAGAMRAFQ